MSFHRNRTSPNWSQHRTILLSHIGLAGAFCYCLPTRSSPAMGITLDPSRIVWYKLTYWLVVESTVKRDNLAHAASALRLAFSEPHKLSEIPRAMSEEESGETKNTASSSNNSLCPGMSERTNGHFKVAASVTVLGLPS